MSSLPLTFEHEALWTAGRPWVLAKSNVGIETCFGGVHESTPVAARRQSLSSQSVCPS